MPLQAKCAATIGEEIAKVTIAAPIIISPTKNAADNPHTEHVQQDAAHDKTAAYAEKRISTRIEAVVLIVPTKLQQFRILEQMGEGREHVVKEI